MHEIQSYLVKESPLNHLVYLKKSKVTLVTKPF